MKKISLLLVAVLLLSLLSACGTVSEETVTVESVAEICGLGGAGLADRFAGIVSPQGETKINKSDEAVVGEIKVSVGDTVEEGQLLFTYDNTQIGMDIERAQLELEQLRNSISAKTEEKAELEAEKQTVSEELQLSYTIEIKDIEAAIQELNYNVTLKSKEIQRLNESLGKSEVTSPVSGRVQSINENGGWDDMGNPLPFMSIVETGGLRVKGYVNEANAYSLSEGINVIVRSRVSDDTWRGSVSMVDWDNPQQNQNYYGDSDTGMSSKYPFYVELSDSEGLMLGQHVYIEPDYGQADVDPNTIMLPSYYIVDPEGDAFVWASNGRDKLEKRSLTLGVYDEMLDCYAVVEGLDASDCIAFPDESLKEGMSCAEFSMDSMMEDYGYENGVIMDGMIEDDVIMEVPEVGA